MWCSTRYRLATPNTSSATSRGGCAIGSRSAIRRSRSRAAIRAARSSTARGSTTILIRTWSLLPPDQRLLALQDSPRHRDSGGVGRVHPSVAEPSRAQCSRLGVRGIGCVVDDAEVEMGLCHVHALVAGVPVGLADLVAGIQVRTRLHLDDRVPAL